jgi:hypothetical protein
MDAAERLEAALASAAQALEAGDHLASAEHSTRAAQATAELEAGRVRLDAARLARCAALQARCEVAAEKLSRQLQADLGAASRSTRANAAYGAK